MKLRVLDFVKSFDLFTDEQKILVAVSGGVDSMVLLHLLNSISKNIAVAHCNFNLRGDDSKADQRIVENFCCQNNIQCFVKQFNVVEYKKQHKVSTQVAARELRYQWFYELREKQGFDCIALAHHADDQVETFLLNSCRGTGITGLGAMLPKHEFLIRPLLKISKSEIYKFALEFQIPFREDQSNATDDYARNKIRNKVVPILQLINSAAVENISNTISQIHAVDSFLNKQLALLFEQNTHSVDDKIIMNTEIFQVTPEGTYFLYEFLSPFGYNRKQVETIFQALKSSQNGQIFESDSHSLYLAQTQLILQEKSKLNTKVETSFQILTSVECIKEPIKLDFYNFENINYQVLNSKLIGQFDADLIQYPLTLRKWMKGDFFSPLGMNAKVKLSDYFINNKFSKSEKQSAWLLCDRNDVIIWLVGHQINDRFKINSKTKSILKILYNGFNS